MPALPFDPHLSQLVKADSLEPRQRLTRNNFKIACDFRQQRMLKHPFVSEFHSRAEYLFAGLNEGNPSVVSHVPQPFLLRVRGKTYTPDFFVLSEGSRRRVIELKPRGEMTDEKRIPLINYFAQHQIDFVVISNESVFEREIEAMNWLEIVRYIYRASSLNTSDAELIILDRLSNLECCAFGDLVDKGDRGATYKLEIALFRLLHRGILHADLVETQFGFDTEIYL